MSEQKQLVRSTSERTIGGVAGGLAQYFQVEPTLVRLAFVVLALFNGIGVLLYFVAWLLIPADSQRELSGEAAIRANVEDMGIQARRLRGGMQGSQGATLVGILLVGIGVMFLIDEFAPGIPTNLLWPVLMMIAGAYILFGRR